MALFIFFKSGVQSYAAQWLGMLNALYSTNDGTVRIVQYEWYSTNGTVRIVHYEWYSTNGTVRMVQYEWYSTNGTVRMVQYE